MNRTCQKPMNFCRERPEGIIGARTITERTSGPGRNMYSPFLASRNVRPDERTPLFDQAPHYLEFNRRCREAKELLENVTVEPEPGGVAVNASLAW